MSKSDFFSNKCLTLALASLALVTSNAYADVYKWRDARGVMQYSDTPPTVSFTKATRTEIINALQSKDVCTIPNRLSLSNSATRPSNTKEKTMLASAASTQNSAFFGVLNAPATNNISSTNLWNSNKTANDASNFINRYKGAFVGSPTNSFAASKPNAVPSRLVGTVPTKLTKLVLPIASTSSLVTAVDSAMRKPIVATAVPPVTTTTPVTGVAPSTPLISNQAPNIVQVALMPAVDITKNTADAIGFTNMQVKPTSELPLAGQSGAVRIPCTVAKMSNDDPIVYPNQPGAAHHHTFFGNTSTNAKSDLNNMANVGNSTCSGGTMNRSAYWMPSMIDTVTHTPIVPTSAIFYYKTGYTVPAQFINPPPKGLRMIAGNSKGTSGANAGGLFTCIDAKGSLPWASSIPNCPVGSYLQMNIGFPQCWDGVNLDSPDHKSHMAYPDGRLPTANKCPATHPIAIPNISVNFDFTITKADQTKKWRLASDNYSDTLPGGFSSHADWVNGWNEQIMAGIVKNCLRKELDAHAHLLCDGRTFYQ